MQYYEIYAGGVVSGEIVIETRQTPDENGLVVMSTHEYHRAFSDVGRECRGQDNYHQGYDATSSDSCVCLHPRDVAFDSTEVQAALHGERVHA